MAGVLLITHYGLGQSFIECSRHFFGVEPANLATIAVDKDDDPDELLLYAQSLINHLDDGGGVLILTDMYGATPSNVACRLIKPGKVEALSGLNLPMLVRAICYSAQPLNVLVEKARTGAHDGILLISGGDSES